MSVLTTRPLPAWRASEGAALALAGLALIVALAFALTVGPYPLPLSQVPGTLADWLAGRPTPEATVLARIRLPRVLAAGLIGAALSGAGAAYQTAFRNPLVSPDILGVSAGAGLGAVAGIFFGLPLWAVTSLSFGSGLLAVSVVLMVAGLIGRARNDTLSLALTGIAVGALAGAGIAVFKLLADPNDQLPAMTFWLLGSLVGLRLNEATFLIPAVLAGLAPLVLLRWRIGTLAMGEDEARALGVETLPLRLMVVCAATLVTAAAVSVSGTVGWVGLMVPHMARMLAGPRFDRMLPVALILGAALMLAIDTGARSLARTEIPLSVLTALIGAPVFLLLLARNARAWN